MKAKISTKWADPQREFPRNEFLDQAVIILIKRYNWDVETHNINGREKKIPIMPGSLVYVSPYPGRRAHRFLYTGPEIQGYDPMRRWYSYPTTTTLAQHFGRNSFDLTLEYFEIDIPGEEPEKKEIQRRWN